MMSTQAAGQHDVNVATEAYGTASPANHSVMAQTGGNALVPQITNSYVGGSVHTTINFLHQDDEVRGGARPTNWEPTGCLVKRRRTQTDDSPLYSHNLKKQSTDGSLLTVQEKHKSTLKRKSENILEGIPQAGKSVHLNRVYIELCITEGDSERVIDEHEVHQTETTFKMEDLKTTIHINDILKPLPGACKTIRTVVTKGIAGIGKTVSVQKFILDWADGKANEDIHFIFPFRFRELNIMKEQFSLMELILRFFPEMKELQKFEDYKILFIFDGLDEYESLNFKSNESYCSLDEKLHLPVLLTNLISGNMFPSALLWITSRPAAAGQIPPESVHQITEIQGFSDSMKEEYFQKRFSDKKLCDKIINHVKSCKSFYIMCYLPIFCWISATVLEKVFRRNEIKEFPTTLTQMYSFFLLFQANRNDKKYRGDNRGNIKEVSKYSTDIIHKLGELAFEQLKEGNVLFYEKDLKACGMDVSQVSYSGFCTEILKEENLLCQEKVYCFVHLTIQEYLAAFHVFCMFITKKMTTLAEFLEIRPKSLHSLHKAAMNKALKSENGHLDLFLRFLLGISLESNQDLLKGLLPLRENTTHGIAMTSEHIIKVLNGRRISPDRCINLIHCLTELNHNTLLEEFQKLENTDSVKKLSVTECSVLAYTLVMRGNVCDEFDLKKFLVTEPGLRRLVPVMRLSKTALLNHCNLSVESGKTVASVLRLARSHLVVLDLSNNDLGNQGLENLCLGLKTPHCQLERLKLSSNNLSSNGVRLLCDVLIRPQCKLQDLDLSYNDLGDPGVKVLCEGLCSSMWKLQALKVSSCRVTEEGFVFLASTLQSSSSHLRELDLSNNHPGKSGFTVVSAAWAKSFRQPEKLILGSVDGCRSSLLKYACKVTLDSNSANMFLYISDSGTKVTKRRKQQEYLDHKKRFAACSQVLCKEGLHDCCYWEAELNSGKAYVGMAYSEISRNTDDDAARLGYNDKSWALLCSSDKFFVKHNKRPIEISVPPSSSCRIGVYLDWEAGILSFYSVSADTLTHLYTFQSRFTEPLYPGFRLLMHNTSWTLCELK